MRRTKSLDSSLRGIRFVIADFIADAKRILDQIFLHLGIFPEVMCELSGFGFAFVFNVGLLARCSIILFLISGIVWRAAGLARPIPRRSQIVFGSQLLQGMEMNDRLLSGDGVVLVGLRLHQVGGVFGELFLGVLHGLMQLSPRLVCPPHKLLLLGAIRRLPSDIALDLADVQAARCSMETRHVCYELGLLLVTRLRSLRSIFLLLLPLL